MSPVTYYTRKDARAHHLLTGAPLVAHKRDLFITLPDAITAHGAAAALDAYDRPGPFRHWPKYLQSVRALHVAAAINAGLSIDEPFPERPPPGSSNQDRLRYADVMDQHFAALQARLTGDPADVLGPPQESDPPFRADLVHLYETVHQINARAQDLQRAHDETRAPITPPRADLEALFSAAVLLTSLQEHRNRQEDAPGAPVAFDTSAQAARVARTTATSLVSAPVPLGVVASAWSLIPRGAHFPGPEYAPRPLRRP